MATKNWGYVLLGEVLTLIIVGLSFTLLPRFSAGFIGSILFFTLGTYLWALLLKRQLTSFTFWILTLNLLLVVYPMFLVRVMHFNQDFQTLSVLGLDAQAFHRYSELAYMILIASTIVDLAISWRQSAVKKFA